MLRKMEPRQQARHLKLLSLLGGWRRLSQPSDSPGKVPSVLAKPVFLQEVGAEPTSPPHLDFPWTPMKSLPDHSGQGKSGTPS